MSMTAAEMFQIGFFSIWFIVSVIFQRDAPGLKKIRSKDVLHLIPTWRFFAPVPARKDYHLEFRTQDSMHKESKWKRLEFSQERPLLSVIWYPEKRSRKAFNTAVRRITKMQHMHGYEITARSLSYLNLLGYLQCENNIADIQYLQFRIISTQDYNVDAKIYLVFQSDWHIQPLRDN